MGKVTRERADSRYARLPLLGADVVAPCEKVTLHPPEFSYIVITDAAAIGHVVALGGWAERGQWQEAPVRPAAGRRAARLAGYWQRP